MKLSHHFAYANLPQRKQVSYVRGAIFIVMLGLFVGMFATIPHDAPTADLQIESAGTL